jgi:amino acid adenylation domain-containing protein
VNPENAASGAMPLDEKRALLKRLRAEHARAGHVSPIPRRTEEERRAGGPLSFGQEQLWLAEQMAPGAAAYNIALPLRLRGPLDGEALGRALAAIVERHEILRTVIALVDGRPVQRVMPASAFTLHVESLTLPPGLTPEEAVAERAGAEAETPFDLARDLPFRAALVQVSAEDHLLLLTAHHAAFDGHSAGVLFTALRESYAAFVRGQAAAPPPELVQYGDFAAWERARAAAGDFDSAIAYWKERLAAPPAPVAPQGDGSKSGEGHRGAVHRARIPKALVNTLRTRAGEGEATLFMLLLAAFFGLLHRYTGERDLVVGAPVSQRPRPELEDALGYYVNMVALRVAAAPESGFTDLLRETREAVLGAFDHQQAPHALVLDALVPDRAGTKDALFHTTFSLQPEPLDNLPFGEARATLQPYPVRRARFDFELHVWEHGEGLDLLLFYQCARYSGGFAARFAARYAQFLQAIAENPAQPLHALPLLSQAESQRVFAAGNQNARPYPRDESIAALFAAHAARTPNAVAIDAGGGHEITYAELDARANGIARRLRDAGMAPEAPVALLHGRGMEFVISALGILKAGGAYLPLDPDWPDARLDMVLRDAGVRWALAPDAARGREALRSCEVIGTGAVLPAEAAPAVDFASGNQLAYIMYTSGSTGEPKGIAVTHRNVTRLVCNTDYVSLGSDDGVVFAANTAFDAATFEIWAPLLNGARIVIVDRHTLLDPAAFDARLQEAKATVLFLTTAYFNQLARRGFPAFAQLRTLLFGGEQVDAVAVRRVLAQHAPQRLVHVYGPTETTTFATAFVVTELAEEAHTVPIGRAIANSTAYVLDAHGNPVPPDVPGEIVLGGDGVARGYLNDSARTEACFVPDPFNEDARLYRTGDLGRYTPEGDIVFLGRRDRQVKIRGHRIEPAELETHLARLPEIRAAHVMVCGDAPESLQLVAYVVAENGAAIDSQALRMNVSDALPAYLVPEAIVMLEALPLNANGKVDAAALPPPVSRTQTGEAPATEIERMLAEAWNAVLPSKGLSRAAHFFECGGNSLTAVQFLNEVENRLGVHVPPHVFLGAPTVSALAAWLETQREAGLLSVADPFPALVPLKPSGARMPFYFVSPAGGVVFPYFELIVRLPAEQPAYGLQDPSLNPERPILPTLEALVDHHLAILREHNPNGPYLLGGWSFGGLVAYEMAQRLAREGANVPLLVLWDTQASYDRVTPPRNPVKRVAAALHQGAIRFGEVPRALPHVIDGLYLRAWYNARNSTGGLAAWRARAYLFYLSVLRRWSRYAHELHQDPRVVLHKLPTVPRVLRILQINDKACRAYRPEPYEGRGRVVLIRASEQPPVLKNAHLPDLGWAPSIPPSQFTAHTIHGAHMWLFTGTALEEQLPLFLAALDDALGS